MKHPCGDALEAPKCLSLELRREAGAGSSMEVRVLVEVTLGECIK